MNQTKLESFIESMINTTSGFIVALLIMNFIVAPLWGLPTSRVDNLAITIVFTVSSVVRGYLWRRFFNTEVHKKVHQLIFGERNGA